MDVCNWMECYKASSYNKTKYLEFAWFWVLDLLHPRTATELEALRSRHDPALVREMRDSKGFCGHSEEAQCVLFAV